MPIYRLPVLTSSLPLQKPSSSSQDSHNHHQHPQQHYVDQHPSQPKHHLQQQQQQQQQQQLDPNENIIKRSHSIPIQMTAVNHSTSSPARVSINPSKESIVEREIRLQLEREAEIAQLHGDSRGRRSTRQADASNHSHGDYSPVEETTHSTEMRREPRGTPRGSAVDVEDGRKVISQYSKVGESLIVRELLEQTRREEELRNHWRNIGMLKTNDVADGRIPSAEDDHARPGSGETGTPSANIRAILRVQPFEDPEDLSDSKQMFITPRMETVIEREIRLQRQREGSLRRARGFPLQSREDRLKEVEIYPPRGVQMGHPGEQRGLPSGLERRSVDGEGSEGQSLQRFATNRLKQEMLRERQREVDLRRQGTIYTISEERVGLEPEEFSSNQAYLVEDSMHNAGGSASRGDSAANLREQQYHQQFQPNDLYYDNDQTSSELAVVENQPPEVLPSWRTSAELRIEEEVKEARRREKELREQRRLANAALTNEMEQQQQIQHQRNVTSQQHSRQFYRRT